MTRTPARPFRSREWFAAPGRSDMAALYLERFMNYGITPDELRSGKPIIGIAQSGSDIAPCNRIHLETVKRAREGILAAGGVPMEFPLHPIFENCRRPTAALDRNLAYLGLVEILNGYPIDAVILTTGCDKTTPSSLMAASTVDIPAIVLSGGPMLDGWHEGELVGSGTVIWRSRRKMAAGEIDEEEFLQRAMESAPSSGHCNTMGTASTMNSIAEGLGMSLPGCAMIPAPYRERGQIAYETGKRIVEMAYEDLRPSRILSRESFLNAIKLLTAIGGSTNAQPHLVAMARHAGIEITPDDWRSGYDLPLIVNMQPAGEYLGEDFHRAGGVPAVVAQLMRNGLIREEAPTVNGRTIGENCRAATIGDAIGNTVANRIGVMRELMTDDMTPEVARLFWDVARNSSDPTAVKWALTVATIFMSPCGDWKQTSPSSASPSSGAPWVPPFSFGATPIAAIRSERLPCVGWWIFGWIRRCMWSSWYHCVTGTRPAPVLTDSAAGPPGIRAVASGRHSSPALPWS